MQKKKHNYVTLIWEEIPETAKIFVIPRGDIDEQDKLMLRACHNNYINATIPGLSHSSSEDVDYYLSRLSDMLADPSAQWLDESYIRERSEDLEITSSEFRLLFGRWRKHMLENGDPCTIPRSKFYRSGFMM